MNSLPWVITGIVLGLLAIGIGITLLRQMRKEGKSRDTNYRALFILGITFTPLGVVCGIIFFMSCIQVFLILGLAFIVMGLLYFVIGLVNRNKWNKQA